jgi:hypothetical protein
VRKSFGTLKLGRSSKFIIAKPPNPPPLLHSYVPFAYARQSLQFASISRAEFGNTEPHCGNLFLVLSEGMTRDLYAWAGPFDKIFYSDSTNNIQHHALSHHQGEAATSWRAYS